jgi:patatin-like phospholipase/acyl hydrolase
MARFNILCLSGGGYLGLYTASVLAGLEKQFGGPVGRHFDLIAGTSVGGIIALGLAAEIPSADIKALFEKAGPRIFSRRPAPQGFAAVLADVLRFAFRPKYEAKELRCAVSKLIGNDRRIGDLKHRVMVPTVNLTKGRPQVFKTAHHETFLTDLHRNVADVAMAASAAPTYFPIAEVGDSLYADGGLYANSPDLMALHEAQNFLGVESADIHVLSIGTTTAQFSFSHASGRDLGLWGWVRNQRLVNVMIASQQMSTDYMVRHRLGERYVRLDALQSKEQERDIALDVATESAQKTIRGLAESTLQSASADPLLRAFFAHQADPPKFFHKVS